ncbi:glutaredoxin family protein [Kocuria sp.]|uniref:glutaredoxin family protein n=1 Tax=Kocuria sp. TaxID=1871328 RepID=UPI0028AD7A6F|nr:glutaredoxin family protein [Kocuria sp.]
MEATYFEIGQQVEQAVARGQGMRVELDLGVIELWGDDLLAEWEAIAPGEGFVVLEVLDPEPDTAGSENQSSVTVYSTPDCVQCAATKRELDKQGVTYTEVDLSTDTQAHTYVTETLGYQQAPVVEVAGRHWYGYRPDLIKSIAA